MAEIPTLSEHAGGLPAFERLTEVFYGKVLVDPILAPVFAQMPPDHPKHVAAFFAETLGAGPVYSGGDSHAAIEKVVGKHLGRHLTEVQRRRWVNLLMDSADEVGLPADPEFRSAFASHVEWGTRFAVMNSHLDENPVTEKDRIPLWNWGVVRGPYEVVGSVCQFEED